MKHYANSPETVHNAFCKALVRSDMETYADKEETPPEGLELGLLNLYGSKPLVGKGSLVEISMLRQQQNF